MGPEKRFIRAAAILGSAAFISACALGQRSPEATVTPDPDSSLSPHALIWENGELKDTKLSGKGVLRSIVFSIDPSHQDPEYLGPSLKMVACLGSIPEYRVQSSQLGPAAPVNMIGDLTNLSFKVVEAACHTTWPVTGATVGEVDRIRVGTKFQDETCAQTYRNMRVYRVSRERGDQLSGEFTGAETIKPENLKPREDNLLKYFKPNCLT